MSSKFKLFTVIYRSLITAIVLNFYSLLILFYLFILFIFSLPGTFSITNGGVFGSMLSTPIINPPQSAILGMHNIVERALVKNGEVVVRPVMYIALSYDHRTIDGRESVSFLVRVKELLEDPGRLVLGI